MGWCVCGKTCVCVCLCYLFVNMIVVVCVGVYLCQRVSLCVSLRVGVYLFLSTCVNV